MPAPAGLIPFRHSKRLPVHSCNPPDALRATDVFWVDSDPKTQTNSEKTEFSINELAGEFSLTHRALRFYESRGLLNPRRDGRRRIYSREDRDRLTLILKGKKLGFTLTEISEMVEAQAGRATQHGLKLTAEKCREQIAHFERQVVEATEALAELRRIHLLFDVQMAGQEGREAKAKAAM
jgi:DNA-binding transcriptional MerR regulator